MTSRKRKDAASKKSKKSKTYDEDDELEQIDQLDDADDDCEQAAEVPVKPTLAEMAAATAVATAEASGGIRCPRCNCGHSRVPYTWDAGGIRRRKRVCRHCGCEFETSESIN